MGVQQGEAGYVIPELVDEDVVEEGRQSVLSLRVLGGIAGNARVCACMSSRKEDGQVALDALRLETWRAMIVGVAKFCREYVLKFIGEVPQFI